MVVHKFRSIHNDFNNIITKLHGIIRDYNMIKNRILCTTTDELVLQAFFGDRVNLRGIGLTCNVHPRLIVKIMHALSINDKNFRMIIQIKLSLIMIINNNIFLILYNLYLRAREAKCLIIVY